MVRKKSGGWFRKSYLWVFVLLVISVFAIFLVFLLRVPTEPQILSAFLYPEKITDGDVLLLTAEIMGAQTVEAEVEHEKGTDAVHMFLIAKEGRKETYEGRWIAHDVKNQQWYNATVLARNRRGIATTQLKFQDPQ
jgi:hypothetical protein